MNDSQFSRRHFLKTTAVLAGTAMLAPWSLSKSMAAPVKRTAADLVPLGKTGLKISRLGIGTGTFSGQLQTAGGKEQFIKNIREAYDRGITFIDTAQRYQPYPWIADAIKGLPREKVFIQSKVPDQSEDVLGVIDQHRKAFNTDYVDSMLIHCMTHPRWTDQWKRSMEAFDQAREKKWILSKGVSCHSLPALKAGTESGWTEVHLVRINPQGVHMDTQSGRWNADGSAEINSVLEQIKSMHDKGRGVIGMKIFGEGRFKDPAERDKSIRFAMSNPNIDAVVIGFANTQELDDTIERINKALAEA